jgi:hypothetical protein
VVVACAPAARALSVAALCAPAAIIAFAPPAKAALAAKKGGISRPPRMTMVIVYDYWAEEMLFRFRFRFWLGLVKTIVFRI